MYVEIIAIGDELTNGQRLDTNSQWLSDQLGQMGVSVRFHSGVGDDLEAGADVFLAAVRRADIVVSTGGLGPTADDLARDCLAAALGVELELDKASLEHIRELFRRRGRARRSWLCKGPHLHVRATTQRARGLGVRRRPR